MQMVIYRMRRMSRRRRMRKSRRTFLIIQEMRLELQTLHYERINDRMRQEMMTQPYKGLAKGYLGHHNWCHTLRYKGSMSEERVVGVMPQTAVAQAPISSNPTWLEGNQGNNLIKELNLNCLMIYTCIKSLSLSLQPVNRDDVTLSITCSMTLSVQCVFHSTQITIECRSTQGCFLCR